MPKNIIQLIDKYEQQYRILNYKIDSLKPLLLIYKGDDLAILRKRIKLYYDIARECKEVASLLKNYSEDKNFNLEG